MAMFDRLKGTDKIVDFVNLYNDNNSLIEQELESLRKRMLTLEQNYYKKVDKVTLDDTIKKEVVRVLDNDYNTEDASERRFVRVEDVRSIINGILNIE